MDSGGIQGSNKLPSSPRTSKTHTSCDRLAKNRHRKFRIATLGILFIISQQIQQISLNKPRLRNQCPTNDVFPILALNFDCRYCFSTDLLLYHDYSVTGIFHLLCIYSKLSKLYISSCEMNNIHKMVSISTVGQYTISLFY